MRFFRAVLVGLALTLLVGMFLNPVRADQWNKKTVLTFSQPIEIPGKVLPAGTYIFKLLDSNSWRHIVQIWNEDGTELITTILAIPNYRLEPTGDTVVKFRERPGDSPEALRAWFYPGDLFGQEFVYPKTRAIQLAQASNVIVPAEMVEPTESTLKTVPLVAITPEKKEEPVTEAIQVLPYHKPEPAPMTEAKELPKTGSAIPLIGLLGVAFIGLAFGLKLLAKQLS
jgi:LPXTG-motif cell wall-anchored protein